MFGFKRKADRQTGCKCSGGYHAKFIMPPSALDAEQIIAEHLDDEEAPVAALQEKSSVVILHARTMIEALGIVTLAPEVFDGEEIDQLFSAAFTIEGEAPSQEGQRPLLMAASVSQAAPFEISLYDDDGAPYSGGKFEMLPGGESCSAWQLAEAFRSFVATAEAGRVTEAILTQEGE